MLAPGASITDAELVVRIASGRGREVAEAELCARFRQRVYLYGLRHLRDAAAAEDLAQEVLATVIERARAGTVNEPDKIGSFVLGTCRMISINRKRSEARRARILAIYGDPGVEPATEPIAPTDRKRVDDCLRRLGDRDRAVVLLAFYAELDTAAIARELGIDAAHARVLRHRALARLHKCVTGMGDKES